MALAIDIALEAIASHNATIISPIPLTTINITSTIDPAITTRLAPSEVRAIDTAKIPAPAKAQPIPNTNIAPLRAYMVPIIGLR